MNWSISSFAVTSSVLCGRNQSRRDNRGGNWQYRYSGRISRRNVARGAHENAESQRRPIARGGTQKSNQYSRLSKCGYHPFRRGVENFTKKKNIPTEKLNSQHWMKPKLTLSMVEITFLKFNISALSHWARDTSGSFPFFFLFTCSICFSTMRTALSNHSESIHARSISTVANHLRAFFSGFPSSF